MKMSVISKKKSVLAVFAVFFTITVFALLTQAIDRSGDSGIDKKLFDKAGSKTPPEYVEGEVLVKFKKGVSFAQVKSITASLSNTIAKHFRSISHINAQEYVHLTSTTKTTQTMLQELRKRKDVSDASPNYILSADIIPNDPRFGELWGLHNTGQSGGVADVDIDAPEAWDKHTGSSSVIVMVIDSGIDYTHTDLVSNLWVNPNEVADGTDTDGNGFIDDIHGINAITGSGDPMDDNGHGTHCSGTIGGVGNNSTGVVGVNLDVRIIGAKFLGSSGSGSTSDSITCIDYAVDLKTNYGQNIVAINASYGGSSFSQSVKDAIDAAGTAGIVFCAAAGNDYTNNDSTPHYPSNYSSSNIISVTAVDRIGDQYYNYGAVSVDIGAPGRSILSSVPCKYTPQAGDIFYDDMESGSGNWISGGTLNTWAISTDQESFLNVNFPVPSPTHFLSDKPGSDYPSGTDSWIMIDHDIDLSAYVGQNLYLGFGAAVYIEDYFDHGYVEVSGNGGSTWTSIMDFTGFAKYWQNDYSYLIPDAVKTANFRLRFRLESDSSIEYWGWLIDNVGIGTTVTCGYESWNGTSMATPHVAGAVALMAAQYPMESVSQRKARILNNTVALPSLSGLCVTGGMLNINMAIGTPGTMTVSAPNGGETWQLGTSKNITWNSTGVTGNVTITLLNNGTRVGTITDSAPATSGTYAWTVGNYSGGTAAAGTLYKIKIEGSAVSDSSDANFAISTQPVVNPGGDYLAGDFNGDGMKDIVFHYQDGGTWHNDVALSTGSGFTYDNDWLPGGGSVGANGHYRVGDFNGDGRDDLLLHYTGGGHWYNQVALSNGTRFTNGGDWLPGAGSVGNYGHYKVGDFNGDGMDDLLLHYFGGGQWYNQVALSNGTRFTNGGNWLGAGSVGNNGHYEVGDFNGDGRDDLLLHYYSGGQWYNLVALSNGTRFVGSGDWIPGAGSVGPYGHYLPGDYNGDGLDDLLLHYKDSSWRTIVVLSNGTRFVGAGDWMPGVGSVGSDGHYVIGDYNGDSREDVLLHFEGSYWYNKVKLSSGTSFYNDGIWLLDENGIIK